MSCKIDCSIRVSQSFSKFYERNTANSLQYSNNYIVLYYKATLNNYAADPYCCI